MDNIVTPFSLFILASLCACLLAVTVPFALWYYFRAKEIAPLLTKKTALETVLDNLTKDIHAAREQLDKMAEDVANAKDKIAERDAALQWLEGHKKEIIDIATQIAKLKAEYEGLLEKNNK